jgi:hypothetical protein
MMIHQHSIIRTIRCDDYHYCYGKETVITKLITIILIRDMIFAFSPSNNNITSKSSRFKRQTNERGNTSAYVHDLKLTDETTFIPVDDKAPTDTRPQTSIL